MKAIPIRATDLYFSITLKPKTRMKRTFLLSLIVLVFSIEMTHGQDKNTEISINLPVEEQLIKHQL